MVMQHFPSKFLPYVVETYQPYAKKQKEDFYVFQKYLFRLRIW